MRGNSNWQTLHHRKGVVRYSLDNAGKIFPAITTPLRTEVFGLSIVFKEPVDRALVQKALDAVIERFPYFRVNLRGGFFWYHFEQTEAKPIVVPHSGCANALIRIKNRGVFPFRVMASGNRITTEFSHAVTDGHGASIFLKALAAHYLEEARGPFEQWGDVFRPGEEPAAEESEDSYKKHVLPQAPPPGKQDRAFHLPYRNLGAGTYHVMTGVLPLDAVSVIAKQRKVTINDVLVALLLSAYQDVLEKHRAAHPRARVRTIRLVVPKNLRKLFDSRTMRNFTLYSSPAIDPRLGRYGFDEILHMVHHVMRLGSSAKAYHSDIARNVRGERHPLVRILPRMLKDLLLTWMFNAVGDRASSGSISNFGAVVMPEKMAAHIERLDFIPAPGPKTKCNCSVVSFGNNLSVSFGRTVRETEIEEAFFKGAADLGMPVRIAADRQD